MTDDFTVGSHLRRGPERIVRFGHLVRGLENRVLDAGITLLGVRTEGIGLGHERGGTSERGNEYYGNKAVHDVLLISKSLRTSISNGGVMIGSDACGFHEGGVGVGFSALVE